MEAVIDQAIRNIVREELAESLNGHGSEPELITAETAAELCKCGKDTILDLANDVTNNGFPAIWLSSRTLRIDKRRLQAWFANGGLGVKA